MRVAKEDVVPMDKISELIITDDYPDLFRKLVDTYRKNDCEFIVHWISKNEVMFQGAPAEWEKGGKQLWEDLDDCLTRCKFGQITCRMGFVQNIWVQFWAKIIE